MINLVEWKELKSKMNLKSVIDLGYRLTRQHTLSPSTVVVYRSALTVICNCWLAQCEVDQKFKSHIDLKKVSEKKGRCASDPIRQVIVPISTD